MGSSNRPKKLTGRPSALRINQPLSGCASINTYSNTCVNLAANCCKRLSSEGKAGAVKKKRFTKRTNTSTNTRSEEHTSELQSRPHLVCRLLLEKKNRN